MSGKLDGTPDLEAAQQLGAPLHDRFRRHAGRCANLHRRQHAVDGIVAEPPAGFAGDQRVERSLCLHQLSSAARPLTDMEVVELDEVARLGARV